MRPVLVAGVQRLFGEQPEEAGTVEEQVAFDAFAARQRDRFDEAVGTAQPDIDHAPFGAAHTTLFGVGAQVRREQRGVELERVTETGRQRFRIVGRQGEARLLGGRDGQRVGIERCRVSREPQSIPQVVEFHTAERSAVVPKGMYIRVAKTRPVDELDAQLERGVGLAHEVRLVQTQRLVEEADVRHGGLAHADDADLGGLDQANVALIRAQEARQRGSRHPSTGASTDDDDVADPVFVLFYCQTGCFRAGTSDRRTGGNRRRLHVRDRRVRRLLENH